MAKTMVSWQAFHSLRPRAPRPSRFSLALNSFSLPLQTRATQDSLFYDPNSFFIFVYRIGIFFQKNIIELDVLE